MTKYLAINRTVYSAMIAAGWEIRVWAGTPRRQGNLDWIIALSALNWYRFRPPDLGCTRMIIWSWNIFLALICMKRQMHCIMNPNRAYFRRDHA
jgi:hypothetical protein